MWVNDWYILKLCHPFQNQDNYYSWTESFCNFAKLGFQHTSIIWLGKCLKCDILSVWFPPQNEPHRRLAVPAEETSWLKASWIWAVYGLVNPSAEPGHGRINPWKPRISTAISPRDQAIDTSVTHQRPSRVSLEHQKADILMLFHP